MLGIDTNLGFLRGLLADSAVQAGDLDTGLIDRLPPYVNPAPTAAALRSAAAMGEGALLIRRRRGAASALWRSGSGWRLTAAPEPVEIAVLTEEEVLFSTPAPTSEPTVFEGGGGWAAVAPGRALAPDTDVAIDADGWTWVHADGATHRLRALGRREAMERRLAARDVASAAAAPELRAPMPGAVVALHAADGARVATGDRIVTIEAMKMEHPVIAPHGGILRIDVAVGDQVRRDQVLAHVTAEPDSASTPS